VWRSLSHPAVQAIADLPELIQKQQAFDDFDMGTNKVDMVSIVSNYIFLTNQLYV
jgi:hypothetical protein